MLSSLWSSWVQNLVEKKDQKKSGFVHLWGKGDCRRTKEEGKLEDEGKMEENHEGTATEDKMQLSIRLQEQTDRSMSEFQKLLPPEILCHRCCCCWRIGFKHPSKACCCPGGKINSSTYCSSKPKLPCKGLEGWETWDPRRLLSILSLTHFSASLLFFSLSLSSYL